MRLHVWERGCTCVAHKKNEEELSSVPCARRPGTNMTTEPGRQDPDTNAPYPRQKKYTKQNDDRARTAGLGHQRTIPYTKCTPTNTAQTKTSLRTSKVYVRQNKSMRHIFGTLFCLGLGVAHWRVEEEDAEEEDAEEEHAEEEDAEEEEEEEEEEEACFLPLKNSLQPLRTHPKNRKNSKHPPGLRSQGDCACLLFACLLSNYN
jgi:hypothetical protein